ncbi:TetR family transcriptional regulator [Amycolatopsis suaedae]|uniref:TetR family transcriptional regulator n=1 Tax=Amycolatopsis suaedae TaxID=2510978 RepID=UPI00196A7D53|nr:TetR family transcriptional regulator [Amycolatopsis suaedae]
MSSPREQIMLAAERLIAERGPDVPLREICVAAGQRNNSAVQYHFGDRDGLIAAIVGHRLGPEEDERLRRLAELEAAGDGADPRRLIATLVEPIFTVARRDGATHHARFLEQVRAHPAMRALGAPDTQPPAIRIILARLERALKPIPAALRARRLSALATTEFALLADHERAVEAGTATSSADALADIAAMLHAMLFAPAA